MVIAGTSVPTFEEANYATLSRYYSGGEWKIASTNQTWEVYWTELTDYDGETVELRKVEGRLPVRENERYEFVQVEQDNGGLFGVGTVETRLRPYRETNTERKPWNPADN